MCRRLVPCLAALVLALSLPVQAADPKETADELRTLDTQVVVDPDKAKELAQMLGNDVRDRIRAANQRETRHWQAIKNKADWERYRDERLQALRSSLGQPLDVPRDLKVRVTKTIAGDGYQIENIVFESRPGLTVTGNLYSPAKPGTSMPGMIIVPSHHNPKTQGELQDMGMSWARLGCVVLVLDSLGHGERRAHPFVDEKSYPEKFAVSRQDYWFRFNTSLQLYAVGESLIGWMAWDNMRAVDLLLARPGVDKDRIVLLGAVAGGGDPAAVTGALDPRISLVAPFNFGGPQPETVFPLPANPEDAFNYAGSGSWESTRNLAYSARDGFLPWVIVGATAPRRLLYCHEFAWDRENDPVWKRLGKIYEFYGVPGNLAAAHGKGSVRGKAPESTHCNNIGAVHRAEMYPAMSRWLGLAFSTDKEYTTRHKSPELMCLTPEVTAKPLHEVVAALGAERSATARQRLAALADAERRSRLRGDWTRLLGAVEPKGVPTASAAGSTKLKDNVVVQRLVLEVEPGMRVPTLLLVPPHREGSKVPVVVGFAQQGKQEFLRKNADGIAALLAGGAAVCLPDLRGTGESKPGDGRGRTSPASSLSASELMLGQTLLGSRLRDLRAVLAYLRSRGDIDGQRLALWGDSFAPVTAADQNVALPYDAKLPEMAEPMGQVAALLGALYEPDVKAVVARGGLAGYQSLLHSQFLYVPHDAVVPGAIAAGDLGAVAAAVAPRGLRIEGLVNGVNKRVGADQASEAFAAATAAYQKAGAAAQLTVAPAASTPDAAAAWLLQQLR